MEMSEGGAHMAGRSTLIDLMEMERTEPTVTGCWLLPAVLYCFASPMTLVCPLHSALVAAEE